MDEYLHGIREARIGDNPETRTYAVSAAPPNPVPELRMVMQTQELADQYFRELFHQHQTYPNSKIKTAAFNLPYSMVLVLESGDRISVPLVLGQEDGGYSQVQARGMKGPTQYLDSYQSIAPTREFEPMFEQATYAMRFGARPICTLEEYINFHELGTRVGRILPDDKDQGKGGVFYEQILNLVQGPGDAPTADVNNNLDDPVTADTRADWQTRLKNYRKKVLFQLHPQEA